MRGLVTTMFERIESMKKFDAHESQFWRNLASPAQIVKEQMSASKLQNNRQSSADDNSCNNLIPMEDVDIAVQATT